MGKTFHLWIHRISGFSLSFALILSFLAVVGCSSGGGDGVFFFPQTTTVTVEAGDATLTCADEGDMVACRGIKYAEALRFAPSEMVELAGDINAQSFGNICIQDDGTGSEDCLFLNVFFPKGTQAYDDLPVMFWIHGGALIQGAGSVPGYDVPALVNEGVVVVTINYRLNAFGFLPHPALEDPTGNFGLKDQVKALEWVREYIADFGGDPQNVTIFGESAGGHSVLSLLISEERNSAFFQKAIVQSGSYSPTQTALATVGYYGLGMAFADLPGLPGGDVSTGPCADIAEAAAIRTCLRGLTVEQVMAAQNAGPAWAWISPVYAPGTFLPKNIATALADGDVADVPIIVGTNLHEGTLFAGLFLGDFNYMPIEDDYRNGVSALINPTANPALDPLATAVGTYYLGVAPGGANLYRNAYSMIWTDATFTCNNLGQATTLAQRAGQDTFFYWFADGDAPINPTYALLRGLLEPVKLLDFGQWAVGASHSFEIQYIFGQVKSHPDVTPAQRNLSDRMTAYWADFAKNGTPGNGWAAYNGTNIRRLHPDGDTNATAIEFGAAHHCAFWANPLGIE